MNPHKTEEHRITCQIGERLRARRLELEVSLEAVAHRLGVSFQQLQKYEAGINRISAAKLQMICPFLETPVSYYFADTPEDLALPSKLAGLIHAWRNLDSKHRRMLEEMANVLVNHKSASQALAPQKLVRFELHQQTNK